jgi:hypothetical protein
LASEEPRNWEVYLLQNELYWYVGSAPGKRSTAKSRLKKHLNGDGHAELLWEKIQEGQEFTQVVLELGYGTAHDAIMAEQRHYDEMLSDSRQSLNAHRPASWDGCYGGPKSEEHRQKISASWPAKGTPEYEQRCAAISAGMPKPGTAEYDRMIGGLSESLRGKPSWNKGKTGYTVGPYKPRDDKARESNRIAYHNEKRYRCGGCDKVLPHGALRNHQKGSGHQGETLVELVNS